MKTHNVKISEKSHPISSMLLNRFRWIHMTHETDKIFKLHWILVPHILGLSMFFCSHNNEQHWTIFLLLYRSYFIILHTMIPNILSRFVLLPAILIFRHISVLIPNWECFFLYRGRAISYFVNAGFPPFLFIIT